MRKREILGGITPAAFMARHWQRRWRLVRAALPGFTGPLDLRRIRALAARDDLESRVVVRERGRWTLEHGPFPARYWRQLPERSWTVLVQGVNTVVPEADRLLRAFDFIPFARMEDVMVSFAAPGGGVGPHFDSYDVFLLQGFGRRRWRLSRQRDRALDPRAPLRVLRRMRTDRDWVLAPGDMLYVPPGTAHDGTAIDACTTYSIGFRAPTHREWVGEFLGDVADNLSITGMYGDRGAPPARHPGALPRRMIAELHRQIARLPFSRACVETFLGKYLTTPKTLVVFDRPRPLAPAAFARAASARGVALDPRTRMLYSSGETFINGERLEAPAMLMPSIAQLADERALPPSKRHPEQLARLLHDWYRAGWLKLSRDAL